MTKARVKPKRYPLRDEKIVDAEVVPENGGEAVAVIPKTTAIVKWRDAVRNAETSREIRQRIATEILKEGIDYGPPFPGSDKPVLLLAGAQKITDAFECYPDYVLLDKIERWDRDDPLFHYHYKVILRQRGSDAVISTGEGSANSYEVKWYWRQASRKCPACGQEAIIKGRREFGGGWLCFAKKGGCGAKFKDDEAAIVNQEVGRVKNEEIFTEVNSIMKIAMKRGLLQGAINFGFSEMFTQDMEEKPGYEPEPDAPPKSAPKSAPQFKVAAEMSGDDKTEAERIFSSFTEYIDEKNEDGTNIFTEKQAKALAAMWAQSKTLADMKKALNTVKNAYDAKRK